MFFCDHCLTITRVIARPVDQRQFLCIASFLQLPQDRTVCAASNVARIRRKQSAATLLPRDHVQNGRGQALATDRNIGNSAATFFCCGEATFDWSKALRPEKISHLAEICVVRELIEVLHQPVILSGDLNSHFFKQNPKRPPAWVAGA